MIQKVLEQPDKNLQKKQLYELVQNTSKNVKELHQELTNEVVSAIMQNVQQNNYALWVQFCVVLCFVQDSFAYADGEINQPVLKLLDLLGQKKFGDKLPILKSLIGKYSSLENSILLHYFTAKYVPRQCPQPEIPVLLATYIRLSSFIIEKYFQTKNQFGQSKQDRIQDDRIIIKNCENWVARSFDLFFNNFPQPIESVSRQSCLLAFGDIIGAMMQVQREDGLLDKQITESLIQNSILKFLNKYFKWNEVFDLFLEKLRQNNFENPLKKIQVPEDYSTVLNRNINTQAFAYIMFDYLKNGLAFALPTLSVFKILMIASSELASRPYKIKVQILNALEKLKVDTINIKSGFQFQYPIQLFLFNIYHFEHSKYEQIRKKFSFESQKIHEQSLLVFNRIKTASTKQRQSYIQFSKSETKKQTQK